MAGHDAGMNHGSLRVKFVALWTLLQLAKLFLAARLPLLVDEAFYAWESRHPAWAYSDLPGLTAWLVALGRGIGGEHPLAVRAVFLVLGAGVPWLVVRIAARWFGSEAGWRAGMLALLVPLSGLLGMLAVPDVPLVFAALLSLDALGRLRERVDAVGLALLALALVIGALSHYRFAGVLVAGLAGMLMDARCRALLRNPRVWFVALIGTLAWWPLLSWNLANAGAGWQFQLLDRNPWQFQSVGWLWLPIQFVVVTPLVFAGLLQAAWRLPRAWRIEPQAPWGVLLGVSLVSVAGYFVLGFFTDQERVSFHWPLAGWLVLIVAAAGLGLPRSPRWRTAGNALAAVMLLLVVGWLGAATSPEWRARLAETRWYPVPFAGTSAIAGRVRRDATPGMRVVADNFELGAKLVAALDRDDIQVLDHALNAKHGRDRQLQAWHADWRTSDAALAAPVLLVIDDDATPMKARLARYHAACAQLGPLPPPETLEVDGGRQRYLLFRIPAPQPQARCVTPALAQVDLPAANATVGPGFVDVSGWAFKDGAGIARVAVMIDGKEMADADYGLPMPHVARQWRISTDPAHPDVGFTRRVYVPALASGMHQVRAVAHGRDGSVEFSPSVPFNFRAEVAR